MNVKCDILGFLMFNGSNVKLDKSLINENDKIQFLECIK